MNDDFRKGQLWERMANFNLGCEARQVAREEYIYLSKPEIDGDVFKAMEIYEGVINEGETKRLKGMENIVGVISMQNNSCFLKLYRLKV